MGAVGGFLERLRGNRTLVFGLAILLVAVPTFAALFPGLINRTERGWRIGVMVAWLAVAALATYVSQSRDSAAHAMARASQKMLLRQHLDDLLGEKCGIPPSYQTTVYLPDDDAGLLLPWYPHPVNDPTDPSVFAFGCGATGYAYRDGEPVAVVGDAVSSAEYGLTPAQQEHFANGAVVVSVPIQVGDQTAGTLSVYANTNDEHYVSETAKVNRAGVRSLLRLADRIGEALEGM